MSKKDERQEEDDKRREKQAKEAEKERQRIQKEFDDSIMRTVRDMGMITSF